MSSRSRTARSHLVGDHLGAQAQPRDVGLEIVRQARDQHGPSLDQGGDARLHIIDRADQGSDLGCAARTHGYRRRLGAKADQCARELPQRPPFAHDRQDRRDADQGAERPDPEAGRQSEQAPRDVAAGLEDGISPALERDRQAQRLAHVEPVLTEPEVAPPRPVGRIDDRNHVTMAEHIDVALDHPLDARAAPHAGRHRGGGRGDGDAKGVRVDCRKHDVAPLCIRFEHRDDRRNLTRQRQQRPLRLVRRARDVGPARGERPQRNERQQRDRHQPPGEAETPEHVTPP
jgi:hypothetical protein